MSPSFRGGAESNSRGRRQSELSDNSGDDGDASDKSHKSDSIADSSSRDMDDDPAQQQAPAPRVAVEGQGDEDGARPPSAADSAATDDRQGGLKTACTLCRIAHRKCSGGVPCTRCRAAGREDECGYVPQGKRGRKSGRPHSGATSIMSLVSTPADDAMGEDGGQSRRAQSSRPRRVRRDVDADDGSAGVSPTLPRKRQARGEGGDGPAVSFPRAIAARPHADSNWQPPETAATATKTRQPSAQSRPTRARPRQSAGGSPASRQSPTPEQQPRSSAEVSNAASSIMGLARTGSNPTATWRADPPPPPSRAIATPPFGHAHPSQARWSDVPPPPGLAHRDAPPGFYYPPQPVPGYQFPGYGAFGYYQYVHPDRTQHVPHPPHGQHGFQTAPGYHVPPGGDMYRRPPWPMAPDNPAVRPIDVPVYQPLPQHAVGPNAYLPVYYPPQPHQPQQHARQAAAPGHRPSAPSRQGGRARREEGRERSAGDGALRRTPRDEVDRRVPPTDVVAPSAVRPVTPVQLVSPREAAIADVRVVTVAAPSAQEQPPGAREGEEGGEILLPHERAAMAARPDRPRVDKAPDGGGNATPPQLSAPTGTPGQGPGDDARMR
eukprot:Opistho-1_new@104979